jgi:hypothetical protein
MKGKNMKKMRTLEEAILNRFEIGIGDAKMTVKAAVLQEMDDARCVDSVRGPTIVSGRHTYGRGTTVNEAWENAALRVLGVLA